MSLRNSLVTGCLKEYQGIVTQFSNILYTLKESNGKLYNLAHMILLECAGNPTLYGP